MSYLGTMSGRRLDLGGGVMDFSLDDLVWGCARQARWGGQWKREIGWYSVAEHMIHVRRMVRNFMWDTADDGAGLDYMRVVRTALCHDLSEGLLGDVATPLKRMLPDYLAVEDRLNRAIAERYDLIYPWPPIVLRADRHICADETRALMENRDPCFWGLSPLQEPYGVKFWFYDPDEAAAALRRELGKCGIHDA